MVKTAVSTAGPSLFLRRLTQSEIFRDYERAFSEATQLPLVLRPAEIWDVAQRGKKFENPFCALMARTSRTCAHCLDVQQQIAAASAGDALPAQTKTMTCFAGLCDSAVPVHLGKTLLGYLQTGGIALRPPSRARFSRIARQLLAWGTHVDLKKFEEAYFQSRVLTPPQYQAVLKLLELFAQHLSLIANRIAVQESEAEPPAVRRARAFISAHQAEPLTLEQVARFLNMSTFYFCKTFKKATGMTFTDYLGRLRVEKAKNLLLNPNRRVSEVAFEVGFQSLTHFNRLFSKLVGSSPTAYRAALPESPRFLRDREGSARSQKRKHLAGDL